MAAVVSPHLAAVDAAWDDGPGAGRWIADRLGRFGPSVGHAVPLGYEAYAVVPIPPDDDHGPGGGCLRAIEGVMDVLGRFTGDQRVHFGMWDGWAWWYETGADPRTAPGLGGAHGWLAADRVERPDVAPLDLPERRYYLWTGPLRSATAFGHQLHDPPSLIWPEDRSWFVGAPIYTRELAVAGTPMVVDAIVAASPLNSRRATPDDALDIDD